MRVFGVPQIPHNRGLVAGVLMGISVRKLSRTQTRPPFLYDG